MKNTKKPFLKVLIFVSVCLLFCGCTKVEHKDYSLEFNQEVLNSELLGFETGKTLIRITVTNTGEKPLTFVACDYVIIDETDGSMRFSGSLKMIDRLEVEENIQRDGDQIEGDLTNDNDGKNFRLETKCYSEELRGIGESVDRTLEFT